MWISPEAHAKTGTGTDRHRHRHTRYTDMTHLGEVPIYLGPVVAHLRLTGGLARQAHSYRRSREGGNECEGQFLSVLGVLSVLC